MYGLHGMNGMNGPEQGPQDAQPGSNAPLPDDKNKQAFQAWWTTVPVEAQAPLLFDFLTINKASSTMPDSPLWIGLTVQKLEAARKASPAEFVDIIEAVQKQGESGDTLLARFELFGKAWQAEKAAEAAKQPAAAPSSDMPKLLIGAAVAAGIYWVYFRKRGA